MVIVLVKVVTNVRRYLCKVAVFLSDINITQFFLTDLVKFLIREHLSSGTDGQDEASSNFLQLCNRT